MIDFFIFLQKMLRNKRVGKTKRRATIRFSNPYRTTGVRQRANRIMTGPLIREGITSVENHEKEAVQRRYSQLANAGMLKQMKELGIIPDHVGVDMSEFVGNNISLPNGVTSVEEAENQRDIARQIEQFNAGIMDEATHEQKVLTELAQKRKKDEYRTKLIQWLAETDEFLQIFQFHTVHVLGGAQVVEGVGKMCWWRIRHIPVVVAFQSGYHKSCQV